MQLDRREMLASLTGLTVGLAVGKAGAEASEGSEAAQLSQHRLAAIRTGSVQMNWPRLVGKNARLDVHGRGPRVEVVQLETDQGAVGWGTLRGRLQDREGLLKKWKDKPLDELFNPAVGIAVGELAPLDFALHDLAGNILQVPVYKMLGAEGPKQTPCYSGMIYFDDLEPPEKPAGIAKVLENCRADVERGYRQLKVKIGRGNRWMEKEAGIRRDIEVTRAIAEQFPEVEILVDGNDGYTAEELVLYLEGIGDVPLFWIEEPFRENAQGYSQIRDWLQQHGRKTLLADGEADPDFTILNDLLDRKLLDVQLVDIVGHGFTAWRQMMPRLVQQRAKASPHAWGHALKTNYISHLAAGLGNVITIEGVTCSSDDVDLGGYRLVDGKLVVSEASGFGMKLLKRLS